MRLLKLFGNNWEHFRRDKNFVSNLDFAPWYFAHQLRNIRWYDVTVGRRMHQKELPLSCWRTVARSISFDKNETSRVTLALLSNRWYVLQRITFFSSFFLFSFYFVVVAKHKSTTIANIVLRHAYITSSMSFTLRVLSFFIALSIPNSLVLFNSTLFMENCKLRMFRISSKYLYIIIRMFHWDRSLAIR